MALRTSVMPKEEMVSGRSMGWGLGGAGLLLGLMLGCQAKDNVWLVQPRLEGWQRELKLGSEQVRWAAAGEDGVERVVAEFPLPGARTGRPTFVLYLRLPAGVEQVSFDPDAAGQGRGFLLQTRGEYAGLARATSGSVNRQASSSSGDPTRRYRIDLVFEDDSHFVGEITATRDDYTVSRFERLRHPGDVARLVNTSTRPGS